LEAGVSDSDLRRLRADQREREGDEMDRVHDEVNTDTLDRDRRLTPEERGRILYETGDEDDPPWEQLTPDERAGWIAEARDPDESEPPTR